MKCATNHTTGSSTTSLTATTTPSYSQGKKVGQNVWKRPKILLSPDKLDTTTASGNDHDEEEMELEDFEINASPYVTKKDLLVYVQTFIVYNRHKKHLN